MLLRTLTAAVGLAVLLGGLWGGLPWVFLLTLLAAVLGVREFYRLYPPDNSSHSAPQSPPAPEAPARVVSSRSTGARTSGDTASPALEPATLPFLLGAVWVAAFVVGGTAAAGTLRFWTVSAGITAVGAVAALLWLVAFYRERSSWPVAAVYLTGGPVYVGFLLAHVLLLAQVGEAFFKMNPLAFADASNAAIYEVGRNWLLFALLTTFATDTGAYLVGRAIGRHPMAPSISPGKTWEGAVGGFTGAVIAALLLERLLNLGLGAATGLGDSCAAWNWQPLAIGATVGLTGQVGDLLESKIKRLSQVKDAGALIPGHGGMLDRLDSLLITIPTVYYLLVVTTLL